MTSSLKPRKQPEPINQGKSQPALIAESMTSHLCQQPDDRVDLKIRTETVIVSCTTILTNHCIWTRYRLESRRTDEVIPQTIASNLEDSLQGAINNKLAEESRDSRESQEANVEKDIDSAPETMKEERSSSLRGGGANVASYRVVPTVCGGSLRNLGPLSILKASYKFKKLHTQSLYLISMMTTNLALTVSYPGFPITPFPPSIYPISRRGGGKLTNSLNQIRYNRTISDELLPPRDCGSIGRSHNR